MPRTAPAPNALVIPGMCPGVLIKAAGGGGGGSGTGGGKGKGGKKGAGTGDGEENSESGKKNASSCGGGTATGEDGAACPGNHSSASKAGGGAAGEPVDMVTGRVFTVPKVDLEFAGPFPLAFHRSYSSAAKDVDVGLGRGWGHSFAWRIDSGRRTSVLWTNGAAEHGFATLEPGEATQLGHGWVLVRKNDGCHVLDAGSGIWRKFDASVGDCQQLTAVSDQYGNTTSLEYDRGRLVGITDSVGRRVRILWQGNQISQLDGFDVSRGVWVTFVRYSHDQSGHLTAVVDAEGNITRFEYEDGLMTLQAFPTGETVHYRYDRQARCIETWVELAPSAPKFLADSVSNVLADGTSLAKGVLHCTLEFIDEGYSEVVNSATVHRCFGNEHGKLDKSVLGQAIFTRTYDDNGHMVSFTDPEGATTVWERDGMGRVLTETDPMGRSTSYVRDPDGHIREAIDPEGGVTTVFRERGALSWTDPIGAHFKIEFDERGLITCKCAPNGGRIRYEYDALGNCTRKMDAADNVSEFRYDFWGRCTEVIGKLGHVTRHAYDANGRLMMTEAPDGSQTRFHYDGSGDLVQVRRPDGRSKRWSLAGLGKVVEVHDENGNVERYLYDRERRLLEVHDAAGKIHRRKLDAQGLLVEEQMVDGRHLRYSYDLAGRLTRVADNSGNVTESEYDRSGLMVRRSYSDGTSEHFRHNGRGELIESRTATGQFMYERNAAGWVVRERQVVDGIEHVVEREIDVMGNVVARRTSLGHNAQLQRDVRGWATQIELDGMDRVTVTRNAAGEEVRRSFSGGGRVELDHDPLGRLARRRVYAAAGSWSSETLAVGAGADGLVVDQGWEYTANSELVQKWDATKGIDAFHYDNAGQIVEHRHASPDELRRVDGAAPVKMNVVAGFGYDASENVLSKTDVPVYDVNNRLTRCGAIEYEWNALGQLTRKRPSNGRSKTETLFEWGTNGLLNAVDLPVGNSGTRRRVEFTYDNFARRTKKQSTERDVNGVVLRVHAVRFVWDGAYLVHELRYELVDGELKPCGQRAFFYDDETGQPLAHREAASHSGAAEQDWAFYLNDQVGTPDRLINSRGEVVEAFAHDVWGFAQSAGTMTPLRFRGQYYDDETGLCFNRFRYYDPEVGRYISPDPLGIYAGVNSYRYADNQPTGVVDPMGLMAVTTIKKKSRTRRSGVSDEYEGQSSGDGSLRDGDDPAVTEAVRNAERHTGGGGQCGEIDALHQMAADIREQRRRDGKAHSDPKEENAAIRKDLAELVRSDFEVETKFKPGGKNMNPCRHCAQIFRELGLHPAQEKGRHIVGADGKSWKGHPVHGGGSPSTQPSSTPPFVGS